MPPYASRRTHQPCWETTDDITDAPPVLYPGVPADANNTVRAPLLDQFAESQASLANEESFAPYADFVRTLEGSSFSDVFFHGTEFLLVMDAYVERLERESENKVARLRTVG